jgi:hypothetical protein
MTGRFSSAVPIATLGLALSTPAAAAGTVGVAQAQTAKCMFSALSRIPEISEASLNTAAGQPPRVIITYKYRFRSKGIFPPVAFQKLDVTDFIDGRRKTVVVGGLFTPGGDLDDADSGMFRIVDFWRRNCGLKLSMFME